MHILYVTPYYAPAYAFGGVTRSVEGMATALTVRGHDVTVLTTDALTHTSRSDALNETRDGVEIIRVRNLSVWLRGKANLSTALMMQSAARKLLPQIDIVHCHEFRTTENLLVTPEIKHKPLVLSPHGTLPHGTGRSLFKQAWDILLSPMLARRFDAVIGLAEQEIIDARTLWRVLNIKSAFHVVPNGVNPDEFANLPDADEFRERYGLGNTKVVLFMGRLHPRKGVDVLARAFQHINLPDARLLIVGPDEGLQPALQSIAQADNHIVIAGYLEGKDRLAAYAAADVFALPAVGEGLSMSVLEAMAAGLPVVISPGCNLPEVVEYGAGREVAVNENELTAALTELLQNEKLRQQMAQQAQQLIQEQFTWSAVAIQLEQIYADLVNGQNRS